MCDGIGPFKAGKVLDHVKAIVAGVEDKAGKLGTDKAQAAAAVKQVAEDFVKYYDEGYPKNYVAPTVTTFKPSRLEGAKQLIVALGLMAPDQDIDISAEYLAELGMLSRDAFVTTTPAIRL